MPRIIFAFFFILFAHNFAFSQTNTKSTEPHFINGDAVFATYVNQELQSSLANNQNANAKTFTVSFDVRVDSTITNVSILNGSNSEVDAALKKVLSKLRFIPATQNGVPIKMNVMKNITVQSKN